MMPDSFSPLLLEVGGPEFFYLADAKKTFRKIVPFFFFFLCLPLLSLSHLLKFHVLGFALEDSSMWLSYQDSRYAPLPPYARRSRLILRNSPLTRKSMPRRCKGPSLFSAASIPFFSTHIKPTTSDIPFFFWPSTTPLALFGGASVGRTFEPAPPSCFPPKRPPYFSAFYSLRRNFERFLPRDTASCDQPLLPAREDAFSFSSLKKCPFSW